MPLSDTDGPAPAISIGRGGVTAYFPGGTRRLGYVGHQWADNCGADTVVVDSRTVPQEMITRYACRSPLLNVDLPTGTVEVLREVLARCIGGKKDGRPKSEAIIPWDGGPDFGNAGSLDSVALDVWAEIARRQGATVTIGRLPDDVAAYG